MGHRPAPQTGEEVPVPVPSPVRRRSTRALLGACAVLLAAACGAGPTATSGPAVPVSDDPLVGRLTGAVTDDAAFAHLQALQRIADEHDGNRAAGTTGYDASVDYVVAQLRDAGFAVDTPTFRPEADGGRPTSGTDRNVVAQTRSGDPGHVVVIGAHLDSVPEGPGIVDNGSGVAALLEIAARLGPEPAVRSAVRFAFFGDEESGAVGSTAYVEGLSAADRGRIALYLNVDMVASANAGYFAQGGVGDDEDAAGPDGSALIGRMLADRLAAAGATAPEIIEFVGDDEEPFVAAGIPVGGAENGDAQRKTAAQAAAWGGRAGEDFDPCYHQACDRIDQVNREVLDRYLRALAGTLAHFATSPAPPR